MRRFLAVTKSSVRAAKNLRTRWRPVRRSTLISPIWKKAIWSCICNTASVVISVCRICRRAAARAELIHQPSTISHQLNVWSSNTHRAAMRLSRRNFMCPSARRISSANTSARARPIRRCTRSAARAGTRPKSRPRKPCATSPLKCSASRPCAKRRPAMPASRTRNGSASLKAPSSTRKRATIADRKAAEKRHKPMDRLICGDVGFGKTEVAIRAAFKCVMDGKQVAILVPTTVLAQQHFNNFRERMADYPIRVELLSRFRTKREQTRVVKDLAAGAVDIVIGTHRIVQEDIAFKDLGLVVIDEEQRFGVLHKEKFKRLRTMVDVLTLSATPIPRTLYLALTGARDMSTIQTPPHDRLPVETIATPYDERTIRDAIQRELNRG